jgi:flagellar biosynthesis protein FlhG
MVEALKSDSPAEAAPMLRNAIAVASGKGGVGKTWLSITLCHALARAGCKTLLFDGDLGLANVDIQLGLAPEKDLGGVLAGRYSIGEATVTHREGAFDIVAGRSGSGSLASLPADRLAALSAGLAEVSRRYHRVVLDLGAGVERTVRQLAGQVQTCLVVTTDEPTSMTDAYAFIKLALRRKPTADLRVVVNMAASAKEGERTYATLRKACDSFLKAAPPLVGVVRQDPRIKEAIRHQTPLLLRYPNCDGADDVDRIARRLLEGP